MTHWKRTFVSAFVAQVCSIIGFAFAFPFVPFFIRDLGIEGKADQAFWAGAIMSAAGITLALFAPVWGALADRYGRKAMVVRSMIGGFFVLMLMSFVQNVGQLFVCRLLQGAFTGTISASVALVASVVPQRRGGFALGMMQAGVYVGMCLGPLAGGLAADYFGYRWAFRIGAVIILLGGVVAYFGTRENFTPPPSEPGGSARKNVMDILAAPGFLAAVFVLFAVRFSNSTASPAFPLIIQDLVGDIKRLNSVTGSVIASAALVGAISAAVLGHAGDRWGHKRILITCALCASVASLGHLFVQNLPQLYAVRILFGLAVAGMMPAANASIQRTTRGSNVGRAYGIATSLSILGFAFGPFTGGWIAQNWGLRAPFLVTCTGQIIVALVVVLFIREHKNSAQNVGSEIT
ncbi:MAG: MFS transporter [Lentisphaeria bacterium]|nr:MFS transporter [Lentisphaeria bacterium]